MKVKIIMRGITKNVILYMIKKLGERTEGRKKLMKLMFLVDHYDPESGKIEKKSFLGNEYLIYYYGVFSFDVMKSYNELVREGKVKERIQITTPVKEIKLPERVKKKVDIIIQLFGKKRGYELEVFTLRKLGIEPYEKEKFFGRTISEVI